MTIRTTPNPSATPPPAGVRSLIDRARKRGGPIWRLIAQTVATCIRYRVTGLAGEAAFFAILSLPPLVFGTAGAVGYVAQKFQVSTIDTFRRQLLELASRALTTDAVNNVLRPTLDDVLSGGRFEFISIGFVLALWSGSRALNVVIDTITIMYGLAGHRGLLKTRALSFTLYLVFLIVGIILLPLVLAGPSLVDRFLPAGLQIVGLLYWPFVLVLSVCFLTTLYSVSVPVRTRWLADVPGAAVTLAIWIGGSALLRFVLGLSAGSSTIYGPLAAPIAVLVWLYVSSLAILIGAAVNAALDVVFPAFSGRPPDSRSQQSDRHLN